MKQRLILFTALLLPFALYSRVLTVKNSIYWEKAEETVVEGRIVNTLLICTSCQNNPENAQLPEIVDIINLQRGEFIKSVTFISLNSESILDFSFDKTQNRLISDNSPSINFGEGIQRNDWKGLIRFSPLFKKNGKVEKVTQYEIEIDIAKGSLNSRKKDKSFSFATSSLLSSNDWFKIAVDHNAVYKISYKSLKQLNIDVDKIDPRQIHIYGNGGAMLPKKNSEFRADDLLENSIIVQGEADGSFDKGDYILFYGEGPNKWEFHDGDQVYRHITHRFSDTTYYFLTINGGNGKRIGTAAVQGTSPVSVAEFDDYKFHEEDKVNLLKSGAGWYGEVFDVKNNYNFTFSFPNIVSGTKSSLRLYLVTASRVVSTYEITAPGNKLTIDASTAPGRYATAYANGDSGFTTFSPSGNVVTINVKYNKPAAYSSAKGWLDYLELNVRRKLILTGTQMAFRDIKSAGNNYARFTISGVSSKTKIWEITDPLNPLAHKTSLSGSQLNFVNNAQSIRQYIAIEDYDSSFTWRGKINNQNLHSENSYDYIIISHPKFLPAAQRLSAIHEKEGLKVLITTPQRIYNEFSSGAQDIVAIRDFIRMIYHRGSSTGNQLKYVLLMGDGSYDNKYRLGGNTNFIPTFESPNSFDPTQSYVSDDFYCLLDSNEGDWASNNELIDIGIGRFPVQTLDQTNKVIDKIERYRSPQVMGDWRNSICFVGDDQDNNLHMRDADTLALRINKSSPQFNVHKIYLDAYKQYSTPGGARYPEVFDDIKRGVERGRLIINYTGHGGEVGWAHERILTMDVINNWTNKYHLALFVTATCEFSRYDDPQRAAGGEVVLLNPEGGGIALLTTVRLVYSFANQQLAKSFYKHIIDPINGEMPRLGDVYQKVKNDVPGINSRNFTLLGDPALRLSYPYFNVVTDSINGKHISQIDTVRALGLVEVKGHLEDKNGNKLSNYNGTLYPTVYDKKYEVLTLNNDNNGVFKFQHQNKKLFKGKAGINKGVFSFQFVVPKDIAYNFSNGRISYYAENQIDDANGYSHDFIVGGTDKNAPDDNVGPDITLFMNDETFIYGGITDENPVLLAKIYDDYGINMAGTGIGHDISAILDGKSDELIVLNDYYSAEKDSYQKGEVRYQFEDLEPGTHKLTLKVWDVYNNSSESTLEFIVQEFEEIKIDKVLNYPNPFTTNTAFWFEHNQPNTVMDVKIQIFTISGKIVKSIDKVIETTGYNQNVKNPITWNGRDEYGDKLGRGVYIYKLKVRSRRNGSSTEKIEKLVIL